MYLFSVVLKSPDSWEVAANSFFNMSRYHLAEYLVSSSSNQDEEIAVDKIKENNPSEDHLSLEWTTAYIVDQEAEVEEDYVEDQEVS